MPRLKIHPAWALTWHFRRLEDIPKGVLMLSGFSGVSRIFGGLDTYLGWAFEFDDTFRGHEWVLGCVTRMPSKWHYQPALVKCWARGFFGGVETFDHG